MEEDNFLSFVLNSDLASMATNSNSIHVLVKMAKTFPKDSVQKLYDAIFQCFDAISCDKNGVCLVKTILESNCEMQLLQ